MHIPSEQSDTHDTAPTRFIEVDGIRFAYRRFGNPTGTPIVLLQHFMATSTTTTRRSPTLSRPAAR
jgi:pimeloyl-ACP methyl ester carboxylesterase